MADGNEEAARKLQRKFQSIGSGVRKLSKADRDALRKSCEQKVRESLTLDRDKFEAEMEARALAKQRLKKAFA
jgi:hypothetical protein